MKDSTLLLTTFIIIVIFISVKIYFYYKHLAIGRYVILERIDEVPETEYNLISSIEVSNFRKIKPLGVTSNVPYEFPLSSDSSNVLDNNLDTSAKYNNWIKIDLGKDTNIKEVKIIKHKNDNLNLSGSRIRIMNENGKEVYSSKEIETGGITGDSNTSNVIIQY